MKFFIGENTPGLFLNHIEITIYDNDIVISEQRAYSIALRTEDDKLLHDEEAYHKMFNNLEEFLIYLPNHKLND